MNEKIVVSIASWPPRIKYVADCVKSLLDQSRKPDSVEVNLSRVEFPNGLDDLPDDLLTLIADKSVTINWEDGNTFVFRKEVPVVKKYYGTDTIMLSCDDDVRYGCGFVERIVNNLEDFEAYNDEPGVVGFKQAVRLKRYTPDFWEKLTPEVIKAGISDTWHFYYLQSIKARCKWGPRDPELCDMCKCVAGNVSPNSARIGGYNTDTMTKADRLTREALGL